VVNTWLKPGVNESVCCQYQTALILSQIFPVISSGFSSPNNPIHRRRHVFERSTSRNFTPIEPRRLDETGTGFVVCAVCGSPVFRIDHHLRVAMIGGDQHRPRPRAHRFTDSSPGTCQSYWQASMAFVEFAV
jgi:hypothetical protein